MTAYEGYVRIVGIELLIKIRTGFIDAASRGSDSLGQKNAVCGKWIALVPFDGPFSPNATCRAQRGTLTEASVGYRLRSSRNLTPCGENRRQVQMSSDLVRDLAGRQIPNIGIKALFGNNLSRPSLYLDDPNATPRG